MAAGNQDSFLLHVAVFGITMSLMCTIMISLLIVAPSSDYTNDEIEDWRDDLISFSGQSMLNQNPWILTAIYTPWDPATPASQHVDSDGWLYGERFTHADYKEDDASTSCFQYIGSSANIKLDPEQKSSVPITYTYDYASYEQSSLKGWARGWSNPDDTNWLGKLADALGFDVYTHREVTADNWNFTGYRYYFDPTLPFAFNDDGSKTQTSSRDGALSIVWYSYGGQEGLSGGLDVYGGRVLLASYTAADIVSSYNSSSGYASTYDFDFEGTSLTLSIRFDQSVIEAGSNLMAAWSAGDWSMAVSSVSAGNFFDINNSTSFSTTAGNMIQTFIQIFTFSVPTLDDQPWMSLVLWLLVSLPMMIALLCVTMRLVNGFRGVRWTEQRSAPELSRSHSS